MCSHPCHLLRRWLRLLPWLLAGSALGQNITATNSAVILTNAAQIRSLTPAEAAKHFPIQFRGVVVDNNFNGAFTIMDDTAGVYVLGTAAMAKEIKRGDLAEVQGNSDPGEFAPIVRAQAVRKIGSGKVPPPKPADLDDLFTGRLDAQWIEILAVVRRVEPAWGGLNLDLAIVPGGGRVRVRAMGFGRTAAVDSTVRLRAVCYYQFNKSRQMLRPYLTIPADEPMVVVTPAVINLDALPLRSVESLMQFNAARDSAHRVRVRGTVIHSQPGEGFWIRDGLHGLHVLCDVKEPLPIGTELEAFGFLKHGDYSPLLEDAVFRKSRKIAPANPIHLTKTADAIDHDADLIECDTVVQQERRTLDGIRLNLSDGVTEFSALMRAAENAPLRRLDSGTRVRLVGVCAVGFRTESSDAGTLRPQFFQMLLRSPADIQILQLPSWWTAEHVGWLTASLMGLLLAIGGSVFWWHRRRVARQMAAIKMQVALTAERTRIARDLHDEIGANLTHISILSTLVSQSATDWPPSSKQHSLEVAKVARQTIQSFEEILWSVNPKNDTLVSLSEYICDYAEEVLAPAGIAYHFDVDESFPNLLLPPNCRHGLLLAVKEVLNNVIKHASAKRVEIKCGMENDRVFFIRVMDNGCGLQPPADTATPARRQGQGLENLRRRLKELGGECLIESQPGQGTAVTIRLPL